MPPLSPSQHNALLISHAFMEERGVHMAPATRRKDQPMCRAPTTTPSTPPITSKTAAVDLELPTGGTSEALCCGATQKRLNVVKIDNDEACLKYDNNWSTVWTPRQESHGTRPLGYYQVMFACGFGALPGWLETILIQYWWVISLQLEHSQTG